MRCGNPGPAPEPPITGDCGRFVVRCGRTGRRTGGLGRVVQVSDRDDEQAADDVETAVEGAESDAVTDEPEPDETVGESGESDDEEAAGEQVREQPTGRRISRRGIAAAVLVLGLLVVGYESWLLFSHHQRQAAAAQALDAAEKYTLVLTGVDPGAIDKNFAEVLDGATGEFKDKIGRAHV